MNIGGFETTRELHRFREVVVYAARRSADKEANYALKAIRPASDASAAFAGAELDEKAAAAAAAARQQEQSRLFTQQKELAEQSRYWAPIHEVGKTDDGGVFAALDFYPRSVQWLQKLRVRLDPASLYHLVNSIIKGLQELREGPGRAHGNLKPSNIFLAGGGKKISRAKVLLSDLSPPETAREVDDVRALGEIIYQCVTHERFTTAEVQVNDSDEWRRLGKNADGWRKLCADLVDPFTRTPPTLADAAARVQELKVGRKAWVRPVAWAAVLLIVASIGGYAYWHSQNHHRWQQYDAMYRGWFGDIQRAMCVTLDSSSEYISEDEKWRYYFDPENKKPKYKADYYRGDDTFSELLRNWTASTKLPDPKDINDFSPSSSDQIRQSTERIESLRKRLSEWPALAQADEAAALLQDLGQPDLAARFQSPAAKVRAALSPEGGTGAAYAAGQLPDAIDELARARKQAGPTLTRALDAAREIRRLQSVFSISDDPLLKQFQARVAMAAQPESGTGAKDLSERLAELADQLNKCAKAAARDIEPKVKAGTWKPPKGGWPTLAAQRPGDTADLVNQIRLHSDAAAAGASEAAIAARPVEKLPDWQPLAAGLDPLERQVTSVRQTLEPLLKNPNAKDLGVAEQSAKLDAIAAELKALRAAIDKIKTPPANVTPEIAASYRAQAEDVDRRIKAIKLGPIQTEIASIGNKLHEIEIAKMSALTEAQKLAEQRKSVLAQQDGRFADDAELAVVWKRCLPGLKQKVDVENGNPTGLRTFFDAAAKTLQTYAVFDRPAATAPATDPDARAFELALLPLVEAKWPPVRKALLDGIDANALADPTGGLITSAYQARSTEYVQEQTRTVATAATAGELQRRMDWCEVPGREAAGTRPLRELADAVKQSAFAAGPKAEPKLADLLGKAGVLLATADRAAKLAVTPPTFDTADRKQLADWCAAPATPPAQRRTAWLALQQMSESPPKGMQAWPANDAEFQVEQTARDALKNQYRDRLEKVRSSESQDKQAADQWLAQLTGELETMGPPALRRYVEAPFLASGSPPNNPRASLAPFAQARSKANLEDFNVKDEAAFELSIHPRILLARYLSVPQEKIEPSIKDKDAAPTVAAVAADLERLAAGLDARVKAGAYSPERQKDCRAVIAKARSWSAELARLKEGGAPAATNPPVAMSDPAKVGPSASGWKFDALPGDVLQYTSTDPARPAVLQFAKVAEGKYLATTELSVEQANAMVAAAQRARKAPTSLWPSILSLAEDNEGVDTATDEARKAARDWVWDPARGILSATKSWLDPAGSAQHYPDAVQRSRLPNTARGGNPHPSHPLQRVSPAAAVYLASMSGTRLPTVVEWKAAYAREKAEPGFTQSIWNRRDVRFETEVRHMQGELAKERPGAQLPDQRILLPAGAAGSDDHAAIPGLPDDKVLWFCAVNSGGEVNPSNGVPQPQNAPGKTFKHLIGNVAEYVTDDAFFSATPVNAAAAKKWAAEKKAGKSRISVIGASALSPANYPTRTGAVLAAPDVAFECDGASLAGYSDVGIRLALDLSAGPPQETVAVVQQPKPLVKRLSEFLETAQP